MPLSDLVEPSPNRVDHLMLSLSLVGTPDQPLCRPMRFPPLLWLSPDSAFRLSPDSESWIDLRAEGPCFTRPVKDVRARAREHLPSYREPASRNPQADLARTFYCERSVAHRFAFSRLVPRVSSASSFLPASALFFPPQPLARTAVDKTRDVSDQLLPPERSTCTRTSCVPDSLRGFHRVDVTFFWKAPLARGTKSWASCDLIEGPSASRRSRTLRRIGARHTLPVLPLARTSPCPGCEDESVGVFFPRRLLRPSL